MVGVVPVRRALGCLRDHPDQGLPSERGDQIDLPIDPLFDGLPRDPRPAVG